MKKNVSGRELLFIASLLFGMLFGAGNLIFPVSLGQKAGNTVALATLGFCITGVGLPLLAIIAMARTESASMAELVISVIPSNTHSCSASPSQENI